MAAKRFGGYFSMPRISRGSGRGPSTGRSVDTGSVLLVLLGIGLAVILYGNLLLPAIEDLECGPDYAESLALWAEVGGHGQPPVCESVLPTLLHNVQKFLPLLFLAPIAFLIFKQVAAPAIAPVMVMTWVVVWLVPSPLVDLSVVLLGLACCCVPHVVRGPVAAFSHAIGLVLWVPFSLLVVETASTHPLPAGVDWAVLMAAYLLLPAVLISVPIIGRRG